MRAERDPIKLVCAPSIMCKDRAVLPLWQTRHWTSCHPSTACWRASGLRAYSLASVRRSQTILLTVIFWQLRLRNLWSLWCCSKILHSNTLTTLCTCGVLKAEEKPRGKNKVRILTKGIWVLCVVKPAWGVHSGCCSYWKWRLTFIRWVLLMWGLQENKNRLFIPEIQFTFTQSDSVINKTDPMINP